jgi:hypothetical protein
LPKACEAAPLETEDAARFKSPIYTTVPPGDHWAEAIIARGMSITASIIAAYFADDMSIVPPYGINQNDFHRR